MTTTDDYRARMRALREAGNRFAIAGFDEEELLAIAVSCSEQANRAMEAAPGEADPAQKAVAVHDVLVLNGLLIELAEAAGDEQGADALRAAREQARHAEAQLRAALGQTNRRQRRRAARG